MADSATGGNGGAGAGGGGVGGSAKAKLAVVSGGYASAVAIAQGGGGAAPGATVAKAKATGTSGVFSAQATSGGHGPADGLLVTEVSATGSGAVDGANKAKVRADINVAAASFVAAGQAKAFVTGLPEAADTTAVLDANPGIASAFGASPVFFAEGELGGQYSTGGTAAQTITDTVEIKVDLSKLASPKDLMIGLFNATPLDEGLGSGDLTLTLTNNGTVLFTRSFATETDAIAFFTDKAIDLGALGAGPLSGSTLDLVATFTLHTSAAGQGFYGQFIIGDPPPGAVASPAHFAQTMSVVGAIGGAASLSPDPTAAPFAPPTHMASLLARS